MQLMEASQWAKEHNLPEILGVCCFACVSISGLETTPDITLELLSKIPKAVRSKLYIFYMGSLGLSRKFSSPSCYQAPDAITFSQSLSKEKVKSDPFERAGLTEEQIKDEIELGRKIVAGTGFAGAQFREAQEMRGYDE